VILANGRYFACDQGIWYVADDPDGPWSVSDVRPIGIDEIPPTYPVYDVRYVYVYGATPDVVYVGYLPGYLGCYPYYGTVVYGTGYRYRSWRRHHYYAWPCTWGFHASYDNHYGRWGFGYTYGVGFLRVGSRWGRSSQMAYRVASPRWFGPGGYRRPFLSASLPRGRSQALAPGSDRLPLSLYRRSRNTGHTGPPGGVPPLHAARPVPRGLQRPNDVFAGQDGKVYQRDPGGNWRVKKAAPEAGPELTTKATASVTVGGKISDVATLSLGGVPPTSAARAGFRRRPAGGAALTSAGHSAEHSPHAGEPRAGVPGPRASPTAEERSIVLRRNGPVRRSTVEIVRIGFPRDSRSRSRLPGFRI
jgi:hypothetical protein